MSLHAVQLIAPILLERACPLVQRPDRFRIGAIQDLAALAALPVPADIVIYTEREWSDVASANGRFWRTLQRDTVWLL